MHTVLLPAKCGLEKAINAIGQAGASSTAVWDQKKLLTAQFNFYGIS